MKEIFIVILYMVLIALIGGFHVYGKLSDTIATLLFLGIFIVPFMFKMLFLPRKKRE